MKLADAMELMRPLSDGMRNREHGYRISYSQHEQGRVTSTEYFPDRDEPALNCGFRIATALAATFAAAVGREYVEIYLVDGKTYQPAYLPDRNLQTFNALP